jgi:hypothetical protein
MAEEEVQMRRFIFLLICVPTLAMAQGTVSDDEHKAVQEDLKQAITNGNCPEFARLFEKEMKEHPPQTGGEGFTESVGGQFTDDWELNVGAWQVFERCRDKGTLSKALQWSEMSIKLIAPKTNTQYFDTRANLLYKMGMRQEAIVGEEGALEEEKRKAGILSDQFAATIEKMRNGQPTWPQR